MTGFDSIRPFVQGIPSSEVNGVVKKMIEELGLGHYADKLAGGYSGGNKRKLSVAVAMIGNPQIVFLVRTVHQAPLMITTLAVVFLPLASLLWA